MALSNRSPGICLAAVAAGKVDVGGRCAHVISVRTMCNLPYRVVRGHGKIGKALYAPNRAMESGDKRSHWRAWNERRAAVPGGSIDITSTGQQGTVVSVHLPIK